jgi:hypothetical protein
MIVGYCRDGSGAFAPPAKILCLFVAQLGCHLAQRLLSCRFAHRRLWPLLAAAGGCIFTNPINVQPQILSFTATDKVWRGQQASFSAQVTDDQTEPPVLEWARTTAPCPAITYDVSQWPAPRVRGTTFTVDAPQTYEPFCVWLAAIDRYGAATVQTLLATPANHPPVAHIDVVSPTAGTDGTFPFLAQFRLSSGGSTDPDDDPRILKPEWTIERKPADSTVMKPSACEGSTSDDTVRCLATDQPGEYQVGLAVTDPTDGKSATSVTLKVSRDRLPCVLKTSPDFAAGPIVRFLPNSAEPTAVSPPDELAVLLVGDDLDPWPSAGDSQLQFNWTQGQGQEPTRSLGDVNLPKIPIPTSNVHVGDRVRIQVEIKDRHNAKEIDQVLRACNGADTCAVSETARAFEGRAGCLLRVTWVVEYR